MTARQEFIHDIAETALHGGIGHWAVAEQTGEWGTRDDCTVRCRESGEAFGLLRAVRFGLMVAGRSGIKINPGIRRDIVMSNRANDGGGIDATAADVIVQLGCFGEIVYG
jgi:hypothetical protein